MADLAGSQTEIVAWGNPDDIEMGVLADGSPFLTGRGLAALVGVVPSVIAQLDLEWRPDSTRPRDMKIAELLRQAGYEGDRLYLVTHHQGQPINVHSDAVCIAVISYYAFHAGKRCTERSQHVLSVFARKSLRDFVYAAVGYVPMQQVPRDWRQFHDRVMLNKCPAGYFNIFREISSILISAMQHGLNLDAATVPDISVGKGWAIQWQEAEFEKVHGARKKYPHNYPSYFPQSQADPDAWIYPIEALPDFRTWLVHVYLPEKFPKYIQGKIRKGALPPAVGEMLIGAVLEEHLALPPGDDD